MRRLGLLAFALLASPAAAEVVRGVIVGISDGDTMTLLTAGNVPIRIRLAEIDAPELHGQPYGQAAKAALSRLAFGRSAVADVMTSDQYGRRVAVVDVDGVNINAAMVKQGLAWATDPAYSRLEVEARLRKLGLWSGQSRPPVAPWLFRRNGDHAISR
jgi:micrococcal nuclease